MAGFEVVEAAIARLRDALERGEVTAEGLVGHFLARIDAYDRHGPRLNAVPVPNPDALEEARASDERRAAGRLLGPLDGVPYTAKDSYAVRGLTVAAGSPAFEYLVARRDAFTIGRLRDGGAICLGLTNMPPMANGGMQRGLYGRAESPYNGEYLTAAFASGSSNGSGTATAASFAAFGLGEETWSSGRAPASNNGLVAYTPSRGVISVRGNWPLVPTMDVVVPHTRSVADLLEVLDVVVAPDPEASGDFWRLQPWVPIPPVDELRPASYPALAEDATLHGLRLGVPRTYLGEEPRIPVRPAVLDRWRITRQRLEARGAAVVEIPFPVVTAYEQGVRGGQQGLVDRGLVPPDYLDRELWDLSIWAWDRFLADNGDPALHRLADVDGPRIFPRPEGALPDRYGELDVDLAEYVERARRGVPGLLDIPSIPAGVRGLEEARRRDFESQLDALALDAVVFPAVADVGPADADRDPASADLAWRDGTWVANGNLVIRHLGIPTVTVPMGLMADIGMPIGLTIAGRGYDDVRLLRIAAAMEREGVTERHAPPRTPPLVGGGAG
ncbi:amidase [Amnibacterium soli]|uniref:Amidase n=1 Tax=Amnibacterium soli TaxID=1282736 RepID=A0ABP8ZCB7_9MICO